MAKPNLKIQTWYRCRDRFPSWPNVIIRYDE